LQFTPLPKSLPLLGFVLSHQPTSGFNATCSVRLSVVVEPVVVELVEASKPPASGLICSALRASSKLQFTLLPKSLPLLGFVLFPASGLICVPRSVRLSVVVSRLRQAQPPQAQAPKSPMDEHGR